MAKTAVTQAMRSLKYFIRVT